MLDYIERANGYAQGMTFEQYFADQKTQRAVERCIEVRSRTSTPRSLGATLPASAISSATSTTTSPPGSFGTQ
jgi:hypothetical protein